MLCQERSATVNREKNKELCRICFTRGPTFLNIFETSLTNCMTIADMFMQCLGENMYPDDELPEFICYDCIEEIMEIENLSEACQAALKYLVCRTRLLKHLESLQEKKRFTKSPSNLTLKKFISEDQSAFADAVPEESGKYSFPLLSKNKLQTFHQCENFKISSESGEEFSINKEINLSSCVYHCKFCSGIFLNEEELNRHEYLFHNAHEVFPCGKCHQIFKTLKSLERHIEKHNFRCKYQGSVTAKQSIKDPSMNFSIHSPSAPTNLEKEESNRAKLKSYQKVSYSCGKCDCSFKSKMSLRAHLRENHNAICPHICGLCNSGFLSKFDLASHKYIHPRDFSCTECSLQFFTLNSYQRHVKYCQEKIVFYKCQFCGKALSSKNTLRKHMVTHSLVKRFKCHICDMGFRRGIDRSIHIRAIHLKQKPHECGVCHKSFSARNILIDHIKIHSDEKSQSCSFCEIKFKTRIGKWKHEKMVHNVCKRRERQIIEEKILEKALLTDV